MGILICGDVGAEVFEPGVDAVEEGVIAGGGADVEAGVDGLVGDIGAADYLLVVEVFEEGLEEGEAVGLDALLDAFEDLGVDAFGVVGGVAESGRDGRHEDGLGDAAGLGVLAEVAGDFAAAHAEADEGDVLEVEGLDELVGVAGEGVVVVADGGLGGAAKAAAVVGDDAMPGGEQGCSLALP